MTKKFGSSPWDPSRPNLGERSSGNEQRAGHFNFSLPGANGDDYETKAEETLAEPQEKESSPNWSPGQPASRTRPRSPFSQSSERYHGSNRFADVSRLKPSANGSLGNEAGEESLVDGRKGKLI